MWTVQLLGGLNANNGEHILTRFRTQRTRALFAYLAYFRRKAHLREALIEWLWPDADIASAQHNLRNALSSLRRQLEPPATPAGTVLLTDRLSVQLNPDALVTDVAQFEAKLVKARAATSTPERVRLLCDALDRYAGALLPDLYDEWILGERQRLQECCSGAFRALLPHLESPGGNEDALALTHRMMSLDPFSEEICAALLRQLRDLGQPDAAVREYDLFARRFRSELDAMPSSALRELVRQLREGRQVMKPADASGRSASHPLACIAPRRGVTVTLLLVRCDTMSTVQRVSCLRACRPIADRHSGLWLTARADGAPPDVTFPCSASDADIVIIFDSADAALDCICDCNEALAALQERTDNPADHREAPSQQPFDRWPAPLLSAVLHTGYMAAGAVMGAGADWDRGAALLRAAHPGQMLCSEAAAGLLSCDPGRNGAAHIRSLGLYRREEQRAERVFQIDVAGRPPNLFPPLRSPYRPILELPLPSARFFGREAELAQLRKSLSDPHARLVTLTGIGGIGKTRLALELAPLLAEAFPGGIRFAPLADLRHADHIGEAALKALHIPGDPYREALETLAETLNREPEQRTLLILDNMEHLGQEGALVVRTLLMQAPTLACLATSRCALQIEGEQEFHLSPLPATQGASAPAALMLHPAVNLLADRARAVRPDFRITEGNAADIGQLCDRLEGMPLAIELAAAQMRVLTPAQILAQLSDRFTLLVNRRPGVTERHRTLRSALEWSFDLLTPGGQRLLAQLAVFRGGWALEAAAAICGAEAARDGLHRLADHALIEPEAYGEQLRFRMLETVREFAWERLVALGLAGATRRAHADFYWHMTDANSDFGDGFDGTLIRLEREQENYAAIFDWIIQDVDAPAELGHSLLERLWKTFAVRGDTRQFVRRAQRLLESCAAVPPALRASALNCAANMAIHIGDCLLANAWYEEGLQIARQLDSDILLASFLTNLGLTLSCMGEADRARSLLEEALPIWNARHDANAAAATITGIAEVLGLQGRPEKGLLLTSKAIAVFRGQQDLFALCDALNTAGNLHLRAGQPAPALAALQECLQLDRAFGVATSASRALGALAEIAVMQGLPVRAAMLLGAAEAIRRRGEPRSGGKAADLLCAQHLIQGALSSSEFETAWQAGGAFTREQAISFALTEFTDPATTDFPELRRITA
jgi:predicted ATPase/DNA-binding SARP family transcriptional activator